jgi:hypothetical protein
MNRKTGPKDPWLLSFPPSRLPVQILWRFAVATMAAFGWLAFSHCSRTGVDSASPAVVACTPTAPDAAGAVARAAPPVKLFQVVGDLDRETTPPTPTPFRTETRVGLIGTDLGYSFQHQGRTYFLFGDALANPRDDVRRPADADVIGYVDGLKPGSGDPVPGPGGFDLKFFLDDDGRYLAVRLDGRFLLQDDVPNTGFSDGTKMYVFFAVDVDATGGRSVLATTADGGRSYHTLLDVPSSRMAFVMPALFATGEVPGAGPLWADAHTLLLWGRKGTSAPILAAVPLGGLADATAWRFFAGVDAAGNAHWSASDADALAAFSRGPGEACVGGFSVNFIGGMNQWVMLERCSNPYSIRMRVADCPLGPWSAPQTLFDPATDQGTCHFMHKACDPDAGTCCDNDYQPAVYGAFGPAVGSLPYGPYLVSGLTRWDAATRSATAYLLMSVLNPYSPMMMRVVLKSLVSP